MRVHTLAVAASSAAFNHWRLSVSAGARAVTCLLQKKRKCRWCPQTGNPHCSTAVAHSQCPV